MKVWKMIFLFKQVIVRFQPLIFQGFSPKPRPVFLRRLQNFLAEIGRNPQRLVPWFPNVQRGEDLNLFLFDNVLLESVLAD